MITKTCAVSGQKFVITDEDLEFYQKMGVPEPTLSPLERMRRRMAFRNQKYLYRRKCDISGDLMISQYPQESRFPVIRTDLWYSDQFDPLGYGQEIDWDRPLMDQLYELQCKVPRQCVIQQGNVENSQYTHAAANNKNCYLLFSSNQNQDCMYGTGVNESTDVVDGYQVFESELCYECVDVFGGYEMLWSQNCYDCTRGGLLLDCRSCSSCLYCVNLVGKEYHLWNKPVSKDEFEKEWNRFISLPASERQIVLKQFQDFSKDHPRRQFVGKQTEDCMGDYLMEAKGAYGCFECQQIEDCRYCNNVYKATDCMDVTYFGKNIELCYETQAPGLEAFNIRFCNLVHTGVSDLIYCDLCFRIQDCALCVGLKQAKYCILNTQYTEEEYMRLRDRVIERLREEAQWGEFFPQKLCTYGYNETVANDYFPLTKDEALARGYEWKEEADGAAYEGVKYKIPDRISEVTDEILDQVLTCDISGKHYRITKLELQFYRKMGIPIPRLCPDERYRLRFSLRNPRKFYSRSCSQCHQKIMTTYDEVRGERVFCESCYQDFVS